MFQYVWYDKNKFDFHKIKELPDDFVNFNDIKKIASVYWSEHCTECAVPLCYNNCVNWECRVDKKCRKFKYGIKHEKTDKSYNATLELKKWGKIESYFFPRTFTAKQVKLIDELNFYISNLVKAFSLLIRFISPTLKFNGLLEFLKNKGLKKIGENECLKTFLVSCYLYGEKSQSLNFELLDKGNTFYRNSINLKPGYNQLALDLDDYEEKITEDTLVRIFGSEEDTCEITFFFLDFVELTESGKMKLLPKNEVSAEKVKCVVWDLDNTLWNGILIEADAQKLELRPQILETIKWLDERGIIQCVASKNDYDNAVSVLKRLDVFDYFVDLRINWSPKSLNINEMAKSININVNTFAFVDDSEHERNEIKTNIPSVRVFKETEIDKFKKLTEFDVPVTDDSKNRRKMYQINKSRNDFKADNKLSSIDFLRQCELVAEISFLDSEERKKRSYELVLRTNQLNLSGKKYNEEEFYKLLEDNYNNIFCLSLKDKFGTYGQSMFLFVKEKADEVLINEFALSCRIAGKCVESAVLNWLALKYSNKRIHLIGKNNQKNALLIRTLKDVGLKVVPNADDTVLELISEDNKFINSDIVLIEDRTL